MIEEESINLATLRNSKSVLLSVRFECVSFKMKCSVLYKKGNIVASIKRSIFQLILSHLASDSRHIRIFCVSIWNILHNAFVFEHQLLVLTECITSLPLLTLILKYGVKEHTGINILWMLYNIFAV